MLVSRLAVGCPLLSTLVKSKGADCIALKGRGAAAGLFALPLTTGLPRVELLLLFVPLAGEPRMVVELEAPVIVGTCTMLANGRGVPEGFRIGRVFAGQDFLDYRHRMGRIGGV